MRALQDVAATSAGTLLRLLLLRIGALSAHAAILIATLSEDAARIAATGKPMAHLQP
jgi:hypothetical protein